MYTCHSLLRSLFLWVSITVLTTVCTTVWPEHWYFPNPPLLHSVPSARPSWVLHQHKKQTPAPEPSRCFSHCLKYPNPRQSHRLLLSHFRSLCKRHLISEAIFNHHPYKTPPSTLFFLPVSFFSKELATTWHYIHVYKFTVCLLHTLFFHCFIFSKELTTTWLHICVCVCVDTHI